MVIAGVVDVVRAMRKSIIPSEMGTGRIIALMRQGEKIIFGDSAGVAWRMLMMGAVISTETGFWHDTKDPMRMEIMAVVDHFCHWCENTYAKMYQRRVQDNETVLYCAIDRELASCPGARCVRT